MEDGDITDDPRAPKQIDHSERLGYAAQPKEWTLSNSWRNIGRSTNRQRPIELCGEKVPRICRDDTEAPPKTRLAILPI